MTISVQVSSQWLKVYGGFLGTKSGTFTALGALWRNIVQVAKKSKTTFQFFSSFGTLLIFETIPLQNYDQIEMFSAGS